MKIYVNGCDYVYGTGLSNPTLHNWPALIGKKIQATIINNSHSDNTNQSIVYDTIKNLKNNYDLFLISWTTYSKFEFYKNKNIQRESFDPKTQFTIKEKPKREWVEMLYTNWYNELYSLKVWLQQIIQLQSVLSNQNYLMINAVDNLLPLWLGDIKSFHKQFARVIDISNINDEQIVDEYNEIQYYNNIIDKNKFYRWGDFAISDITYPRNSAGKILEEGHEFISDLIINHLCLRR